MKHTVILLALLLAAIYAVAAPADPTPAKVAQPNGDTITIRLVGDEYGSWYETIDGYIIEKAADGYWRYASAVVNDTIRLADIVSKFGISKLSDGNTIDQQQVRAHLSLLRQQTKAELMQSDNDSSENVPVHKPER